MLKHYIDRLWVTTGTFIPVSLGTIAIFLLGRCYEWFLLIYQHGAYIFSYTYAWSGLVHDIQFGLIVAVPVWLLFKTIRKVYGHRTTPLKKATLWAAGLTNLLLVSYFSNTLVPLGAEFWSYSMTEISHTIVASEGITIGGVILFVASALLLLMLIHKIFRWAESPEPWSPPAKGMGITVFISLVAIATTNNNTPGYSSNKLEYFVSQSLEAANLTISGEYDTQAKIREEYPFLHADNTGNVLGGYFEETQQPPNIVFIIVESLGGEFMGENGRWTGFVPYLDSLARRGLYWENGLSLSGRTFGLMPALFGSLPPTRGGFMGLGPDYPYHQTLISLLDQHGYHTAFYSGFDTYFDNLNYFLDYQQIDFVLGKQQIGQNPNRITGGMMIRRCLKSPLP